MTDLLYSKPRSSAYLLTGTRTAGTKAASGDNTLIAAPAAGYRIVVKGWHVQNESSTATTFTLKDGSTVKYRYLAQNQGDSLGRVYDDEWEWRLTEATALVLNLSGANSHGYWVEYWTEVV